MKKPKILIVGAGASGMMAAGQAASQGADVTLLEKMEKPGKKILISGKGRCNLTNNSELHDFIEHFNRNGRFLYQPFSHFFVQQLMDFFENLGLPLITERGNRVFPATGNGATVISTLLSWLKTHNVNILYSTPVTELTVVENRIAGVRSAAGEFSGDAVILATGGSTYPATGSTGDGYAMAESVGHSLIPLRPALVPLVVKDPELHKMAGLDLRNVGLRIFVNGKRKKVDFGEVGFMRFGIGGPVILTHSLFVADCLAAGKKVEISLDLKPALNEKKLHNRLQREFENRHNEKISSVLRSLLPQKMIAPALSYCALDSEKNAEQITADERNRLILWLKDYRIPISGHRPLHEAIVTAGGVNVKEIDPNTMQSRRVKNLFITGELLDIHGDTGGYNLQAAFSTGWLAGRSSVSLSYTK